MLRQRHKGFRLENVTWNNRLVNFEALALEHKDAVYRQMIRVCRNREDAEDVLIDALLKAYRNLDQLRDSKAFRSWLTQIAKRVCWQLKQRNSVLPLLQLSMVEEEGQQVAGSAPGPDELAAAEQMRMLLQSALDNMPKEYQEVYLLSDIEDVPGPQAANQLGISLAALKSRLHRARALLREELDRMLNAKEGRPTGIIETN